MALAYTSSPHTIQHMIRMHNTNIAGHQQIIKALCNIRGIGMRFAHALLRRTGIRNCRAGELTTKKQEQLSAAISDPQSVGIPVWMFNHQCDYVTGEDRHLVGNQILAAYRFGLERGKRIGAIRESRLARGMKVRGQRTKSNGRKGRIVGVSKKK